jgi:hypothetical protein
MKLWADFFDYVLAELPGVPQDVATLHIRNAAIDFCDQTGVYVYGADPIDIQSGEAEYDLEPPSSNYDVARVGSAWVETNELTPMGEDMLRTKMINWTEQKGYPQGFMHTNPNEMRLVPIPDSNISGALKVRLVLRPARTGRGVEDWIFNKYVETIASGAKYRLASMPQKPWSSADVASYHGKMYEAGIQAATSDASKSYTRAKLQVYLTRIV